MGEVLYPAPSKATAHAGWFPAAEYADPLWNKLVKVKKIDLALN